MEEYCNTFSFRGQLFEISLRTYLSTFRMVGESQVIERCLRGFSHHFFNDNKAETVFKSQGAAMAFTYSVMLLHTDLHNPVIKVHMTKEEFVKNLRDLNDGGPLPLELLDRIYDNLLHFEFSTPDSRISFANYSECNIYK